MRVQGIQPRQIRVAHVALQLNIGGMEKLLVEFAKKADRRRFDLRFVSLGGRGRLAVEIEAHGWPVTCLDEPPGFRLGSIAQLAQLFRRWKLDIVHTHNTKPLILGASAARLARIPKVIHTRHGQRFQASSRETKMFWLASHMVDRMICVSQDSAQISATEGISARKLATVWNGIDLDRFAYSGPQASGPVVMVGRLSPEKGAELLLRAADLIVRQQPWLRLEIAGDGVCLPGLRRLADELGIQKNVVFLGEVADIPSVLARASLFVLPSLTEGISLTLLEAMARGLPVVATRVGGNPEVVNEGETGFLVPTQSPVDLANAILHLIGHPELGRQMGLAGRARVERYFDVRQMVASYETFYSRLLGLANTSSPLFCPSLENTTRYSLRKKAWKGPMRSLPFFISEG